MSTRTFMTGCPVVRDEVMKLYERVEVGGKSQFIPFEQRILWIRQSETEVRLSHRGVVVKELHTLNDYYGFMSSIENLLSDEAPRIVESYRIDDTTDLLIEAQVSITDTPAVVDLSPDHARYRGVKGYKQYYGEVPSYHNGGKWWFTSSEPEDPSDQYSSPPTLGPAQLYQGVIWTSRDGVGEVPEKLARWIAEQRAAATPLQVYPSTEA